MPAGEEETEFQDGPTRVLVGTRFKVYFRSADAPPEVWPGDPDVSDSRYQQLGTAGND